MESKSKCPGYVRAIQWVLTVGAVTATGCAGAWRDSPGTQRATCESGQICTLDGRLSAGHPWEAQLETRDGCIATAVPESFASVASQFDGKRVRVVGRAFPQPSATPEAEMYYYRVREMRVNVNICRLALVVFTIESPGGNKWINEELAHTEE